MFIHLKKTKKKFSHLACCVDRGPYKKYVRTVRSDGDCQNTNYSTSSILWRS